MTHFESLPKFGYKIKTAIEKAREQVAALIGAHPMEVIFTSCATESNNAAIHAVLKTNPNKQHIVTSAVEHSSVLNYCKALEKEGCRVTYLPVDREGLLKLSDLENAISDETAVVSLMWANNETGVLFPVKEIAEICQARGTLYHCDAVQAAGKVDIDLRNIPINYLSNWPQIPCTERDRRPLRAAQDADLAIHSRRSSRTKPPRRNGIGATDRRAR